MDANSVPLPVTLRSLYAIAQQEPSCDTPRKERSISLLNAMIYSLRMFADPFCSLCIAITHLFKAFYYLVSLSSFSLHNANIELLKTVDYLINVICAPVFNCILTGKCTTSIILPKMCYRQATTKEKNIILQFNKYQKDMYALSSLAIKDLMNYNLKTKVPEKIQKLKDVSEKTRLAYYKLKLYTI